METVRVALGEKEAEYANEYDPKASDPNLPFEGIPLWKDYNFDTINEARAFMMGIEETIGAFNAYAVIIDN